MRRNLLKRFMYLSIVTALATIGLKFTAYFSTGSMGFFSDALESFVNLFAAIFGLIMIHISEKPADEGHNFGHGKAEYFSSAVEGGLIVVAAFSIIYSAVPRMVSPQPLENLSVGLLFSVAASTVNLLVGILLIRNGKRHKSLILEADGKHLMTDVWTSAGVILAILLVKLTGWIILDPIIAIVVALNIIYTGYKLIGKSANGLMDKKIPEKDMKKITDYLDSLESQNIHYHSLLTREAGQRRFISMHLLLPGTWSVKEGHDKAEIIEQHIEKMFEESTTVTSHIEPLGDPQSFNDIGIDRVVYRK